MSRLLSSLQVLSLAAALFLGAAISMTPAPAQAGTWDAAGNWLGNTLFGWSDCFKGVANEAGRIPERAYVGALVTIPVSCGVNLLDRYLVGNVGDLVAVPAAGKNLVNPPTLSTMQPPIILP